MKYTYEQMNPLGRWCKVTTENPPIIANGRIKTAEGQGPRVRNVSLVEEDCNPLSASALHK